MLAELMKDLFEVHEQSLECTTHNVAPHAVLERLAGKEGKIHLAIPHTPQRLIERLGDFVRYVTARRGLKKQVAPVALAEIENDSPWKVPSEGSIVFYNESAVCYYESPHDQRGITAVMKLQKTPEYVRLSKETEWMDPLAFNRFLRIDLRGFVVDDSLPALLSRVKFENIDTSAADVSRARANFGKEITSTVLAGSVTIPEEVIIRVKPYVNLDYYSLVPFALDVNHREGKFRLIPYPSEMVKLVDETMATIGDKFDPILPSYFGSSVK